MLNSETEVSIYADWVEFRNETAFGTQVIQVYVALPVPRLAAWVEYFQSDERRRAPLTLPLDELIEFSLEACKRTNRPTLALTAAHEALESNPWQQDSKENLK